MINLQLLMFQLLLRIMSEAGVVAGIAARQTEERKHICNDPICS